MRGMDLDHLEACFQGSPGAGLEGGDDLVDACLIQGHRQRIGLVERNGARGHHRPAALLSRLEPGSALPGRQTTCLAPGMGQLNPGDGSLRADEPGYAGQRLDVLVGPDAHVRGRDAAVAGHGRRLDHDQCRPASSTSSQMHEVPVVGQTFLGTVLAHWGHGDAVAKGNTPDRQRTEQVYSRYLAVVLGRPGRRTATRGASAGNSAYRWFNHERASNIIRHDIVALVRSPRRRRTEHQFNGDGGGKQACRD